MNGQNKGRNGGDRAASENTSSEHHTTPPLVTGQCASRCISEHDTRQAAWAAGMAAMQQFPAVFSFCVTERTRTSSPAPCAALPVQLREAA